MNMGFSHHNDEESFGGFCEKELYKTSQKSRAKVIDYTSNEWAVVIHSIAGFI